MRWAFSYSNHFSNGINTFDSCTSKMAVQCCDIDCSPILDSAGFQAQSVSKTRSSSEAICRKIQITFQRLTSNEHFFELAQRLLELRDRIGSRRYLLWQVKTRLRLGFIPIAWLWKKDWWLFATQIFVMKMFRFSILIMKGQKTLAMKKRRKPPKELRQAPVPAR